jgi:hypothetical protein
MDTGQQIRETLSELGKRLLDRHVRLAVTGLSRSGKTVFTASLIHFLRHLRQEKHLAHFGVEAIEGVEVQGSPSLDAPLFPYHRVIDGLGGAEPAWPEGTRAVSEIRIAIRFRPKQTVFSRGSRTLYVDVVDYPGEWLLDLPLMKARFAEWSQQTLALVREEPRLSRAGAWLDFAARLDPAGPADHGALREGARLYREFLLACHHGQPELQFLQPGRFLMPGELEGAPMLEFFPLAGTSGGDQARSLRCELEQRFEAYKRHVVQPFYDKHFAQFDRQIVLVDLVSVLNGGEAAYHDTRIAVQNILENFRYGRAGWWSRRFSPRIDRLLFAVTKADRVGRFQAPSLRHLFSRMFSEPENDIAFQGVQIRTLAVSALCCTQDVHCAVEGRPLSCVQGRPLGLGTGEGVVTLFPGLVPAEPPAPGEWRDRDYQFVDFAPPRLPDVHSAALPQLKMAEVVHFLLEDRL